MYCACWVSTASETQGWENTQRVLFDSAAQTSGFVRVAPNFWGWGVHNHTSLQLLLPMTRVVQALKLKLSSRGLSFCSHQTEISSKKSRFSVRVFCWTRESNTKLPKLLPTKKTSGTRYRHVVKRDEPWSKTGKNANSDSEHLKQMKPLSKGPKRKWRNRQGVTYTSIVARRMRVCFWRYAGTFSRLLNPLLPSYLCLDCTSITDFFLSRTMRFLHPRIWQTKVVTYTIVTYLFGDVS